MRISRASLAAALCLASTPLLAASPEQAIREALHTLQADLVVESVTASPVAGLHQVQLDDGSVLYASGDGQYLLQGNLFKLNKDEAINLTAKVEGQVIAKKMGALSVGDMVVFPAAAGVTPKTHITVFTDTDCGYCQKLHSEVPELNRRGVEVRYVAYPRQGIGSSTYQTMQSVWCAKDRREAMNRAKVGKEISVATCENPIKQQYELGLSIGVKGTPAIVLADGQLIPGYQPAPQLAAAALAAATDK